eukprot:Sspe_Gene.29617::Locus_14164_Transcript_1_1_Confidence_1.000_Length_550::g.29617::m.29617
MGALCNTQREGRLSGQGASLNGMPGSCREAVTRTTKHHNYFPAVQIQGLVAASVHTKRASGIGSPQWPDLLPHGTASSCLEHPTKGTLEVGRSRSCPQCVARPTTTSFTHPKGKVHKYSPW